jgi:branched-chain amino acid transport system permease protein
MKKSHMGMVAAAAIFLLVTPQYLKNYGIYLMSYWLIFVLATMGLNLTVGYAGQKSLGHAAFFGLGAYSVAILMKAGFSWWLGLPVGMLVCFATGIIVGFPALRVQTIYLAFATLGFNTAIYLVMRNEEWLTGGTFGINNIARPGFMGLSLDKNLTYYYFVLAVVLVFALLPSRRCVTTRSALKAWALIPATTRCWPLQLVLFTPVLPGLCLPRWLSLLNPRRLPWAFPS